MKRLERFETIFYFSLTLLNNVAVEDFFIFFNLLKLALLYSPTYTNFLQSWCFLRRPQKLAKSSSWIWHLLHNVKMMVNISSIFVAFLENMNFNMVFKAIKIVLRGNPCTIWLLLTMSTFNSFKSASTYCEICWSKSVRVCDTYSASFSCRISTFWNVIQNVNCF